jgi:hypothetical protein
VQLVDERLPVRQRRGEDGPGVEAAERDLEPVADLAGVLEQDERAADRVDRGRAYGRGNCGARPEMLCFCNDQLVPDPVSWLLIRRGWKVVTADGAEYGQVDEVAGDENSDIFDGLAVATSAFAKPRYVPAEQVAEITDGVVHLSVGAEEAAAFGEYLEPASSEEIEPDSKGGLGESIGAEARKLEGDVLAPTQRHEHPMNIWRRIAFFFGRLFS